MKPEYLNVGPATVDDWRAVGRAEMYTNVSTRVDEDQKDPNFEVDAGYFTSVARDLERARAERQTRIDSWKELHAEGLASYDTRSCANTVARWRGQIEACDEILKVLTRHNDDLDFVTKFS